MTPSSSHTPPPGSGKILDAANRIQLELNRKYPALRLDSGAADELETAYADYMALVGQEAVRSARRDRLSSVDRTHVQRSVQRLDQGRTSRSGISEAGNTVGSVLAGAGLSLLVSILTSGESLEPTPVIVGVALSIVGSVLVSLALSARRR